MISVNHSTLHRFSLWFASAGLLLMTGCGSGLGTSYGSSKGYTARRSVNGFSALRDSYASAGFEHRDLYRLTNRAKRASVVVWTPTHPSGVESKTTRWFDKWLRSGNKTLVFVLPDSGSEADFYREARQYASPEQRLEYRRKYSERLLAEHGWHLGRTAYPSNGWFSALPKVQRSALKRTAVADSYWNQDSSADESTRSESDVASETHARRIEWSLHEFDSEDATLNAGPNTQRVGPGQPSWSFDDSITATKTEVVFEPILETEDGDAAVARVTSRSWNGSQIIVVAGGSLLTNFGLTESQNRRLTSQLIRSCKQPLIDNAGLDAELTLFADGSQPLVGFANASPGLPISEKVSDIPRAAGAELLTVFPISFVTIHIAILGFAICMALMPTFGRPRKMVYHALTHFGDHLDAVAALMRRRGGETFARRRISDYMRRVRGESAGEWVLPESTPLVATASKPLAESSQTAPSETNSEAPVTENPFESSEADR